MRVLWVGVVVLTGCLPMRLATPYSFEGTAAVSPESPAPVAVPRAPRPEPARFQTPTRVIGIRGPPNLFVSRLAQAALVMGLTVVEVNPQGGVVRVQISSREESETARFEEDRQEILQRTLEGLDAEGVAALRSRTDPATRLLVYGGQVYSRKLTVTAVVGAGTATIDPAVALCWRTPWTDEKCTATTQVLEAGELKAFEALARTLYPPEAPTSVLPSSDI